MLHDSGFKIQDIMNIFRSVWIWVIVVIVILGIWLVGAYNRFITLDQAINGQWAQVEVGYQRRFDLIPNLVNSVKGIFNQERQVFKDIADARTRYAGATSVDQKAQAASQVEGALARLLVIVENYPQLRSSEAVKQLMDELAGTENRIAVERKRYNDLVQEYNVAVKRVPGTILASLFGFKGHAFFQAASGAQNAPSVNF